MIADFTCEEFWSTLTERWALWRVMLLRCRKWRVDMLAKACNGLDIHLSLFGLFLSKRVEWNAGECHSSSLGYINNEVGRWELCALEGKPVLVLHCHGLWLELLQGGSDTGTSATSLIWATWLTNASFWSGFVAIARLLRMCLTRYFPNV